MKQTQRRVPSNDFSPSFSSQDRVVVRVNVVHTSTSTCWYTCNSNYAGVLRDAFITVGYNQINFFAVWIDSCFDSCLVKFQINQRVCTPQIFSFAHTLLSLLLLVQWAISNDQQPLPSLPLSIVSLKKWWHRLKTTMIMNVPWWWVYTSFVMFFVMVYSQSTRHTHCTGYCSCLKFLHVFMHQTIIGERLERDTW